MLNKEGLEKRKGRMVMVWRSGKTRRLQKKEESGSCPICFILWSFAPKLWNRL